jgi:hypothetical protein
MLIVYTVYYLIKNRKVLITNKTIKITLVIIQCAFNQLFYERNMRFTGTITVIYSSLLIISDEN